MIVYSLLGVFCLAVLVLVCILAGWWMKAHTPFILGLLGLLLSWYALFVWLAGMTEGWLVPWDTTPVRPAVGTWQRTVNDFFEGPPGSLIPSLDRSGD